MGCSHGARASRPGVYRDAGWSHRRSHACGREATRPARAGATERTGTSEVPVDGRLTQRRGWPAPRGRWRLSTSGRGRSVPPGRGRSAAPGCSRPPVSGRGRSTPRGRGGEHPGASGRALAREPLPGAAQTGEVGDGSQRSRAEAGRVPDVEMVTPRPWSWLRVFRRANPAHLDQSGGKSGRRVWCWQKNRRHAEAACRMACA
jgi:hypothetical protein